MCNCASSKDSSTELPIFRPSWYLRLRCTAKSIPNPTTQGTTATATAVSLIPAKPAKAKVQNTANIKVSIGNKT